MCRRGVVCVAISVVVAAVAFRLVYDEVLVDYRTPLDLRPTQLWVESGQYFSYDGFAIWYRTNFNRRVQALQPRTQERTERPVIVLLHGYPGSSFEFVRLWRELSTDYDIVALDFLGCGASDKPYNFP